MKNAWKPLAAACALVIGVYAYISRSGEMESLLPNAANTYYNLLARGFGAGQLSLRKELPPGFAQLADPYDPTANARYRSAPYGLHDLSYYKDRLFLYFGITPALILFWPFVALTGQYLFHRQAVLIFCSLGFLASAALLGALWRRYFADVTASVVSACVLAVGLAACAPMLLAGSEVYQVAVSCGYMLTMLFLLAIWYALHEPQRRSRWLVAASVAYGLALGARPSLLWGAVILLVPVVIAWSGAQPRKRLGLLLAAGGPIFLIGLGLMLYNDLRFDSPFEFGQRYQLAEVRMVPARFFSPGYLWFNFRVYFLDPARWSSGFPFVRDIVPPPIPPGHIGVEGAFGILTNIPLVWLALAAPLAWRNRPKHEAIVLRGFVIAVALLFASCALTLGLFWGAIRRYEVEFLTPLLLLAVVGILGLERALANQPTRRTAARCGWGLLIAFSIAFNLLSVAEQHAEVNYTVGTDLLRLGRVQEAAEHYQHALRIKPDYCEAHYNLGSLYLQIGRVDEAIPQFHEALRLLPGSSMAAYGYSVRLTLGNALLHAGKVQEAISLFQEALQIKPDSAEVHTSLGDILLRTGKIDEAMGHYKQALQVAPDLAEAHYGLGNALAAAGKRSEAIPHYERAVEIKPGYADAHAGLGLAFEETGSPRKAIGHYEQALRIKPEDPLVQNNVAWLLATLAPADGGDPARAVALAERICKLTNNQSPPYLDTLAAAYATAGRFNDAVATAQKAIDLANAAGLPQVAKQIEPRLQLYRNGQPYRRTPAVTTPPSP